MTKPEILSETPINTVDLKKEIENIKKRDKELNFRAERTEEYLQHITHLTPQKGKELYEKLEKLAVPRIKDAHIHKIIDTMPDSAEAMKAVLQGYVITVSQENIKKLVGVVAEFSGKKK
ncbi:hypothetical protein J4227_07775 [Candidatus Woesearchaeota archaeon]|nr:hypothetical protein [Candidatus Woesearchaeota archaeon]